MRNIMLILGGGGIRGLAHIGVLKALELLGISISEYAGTSAGAIVAAMAASGMKVGEIERIGLSIRKNDIFDFNYPGLLISPSRVKSLCKGENLQKFIKKVIPMGRFDELQKPLFLGAVDIGSGEMTFWGMDADQDISLHDAIYASCAIPGIFPPQKIGKVFYFDGAVVDGLPQLLQARPSGLVTTQTQKVLQAQRTDPVLLVGDPPHGPEPPPKGKVAPMEDRPGCDRSLISTNTAFH